MYPLPQTLLPLTSGFIPRPSSTFLLHHHLQWKKPNHIRHHRARNPYQAVQYHVAREHPLLLHHSHQHNQMIAPPTRLLRPQCPTLQKRRYQNHSMERESKIAENKLQCPQLLPKTVDSASDVNSHVTKRKTAPSYHTVLNVELDITSQQCVLPNNRTIDSKTKDSKVLMKDAKPAEKIGRNHRTGPQQGKQQQHPPPQICPPNQPTNSLIRHNNSANNSNSHQCHM